MSGASAVISGMFKMTYLVFLETAPFLIIGLFLAGWMKILIPTRGVHRYLGQRNLRSALYAALFGLPMPICSCGVVPLSIGLRDKGATREANLSFLISTPETSIDTIIITWGLLGPIMAVVRPLVSLFTSLFAAILSIGARTDQDDDNQGDGDPINDQAASAPTSEDQYCRSGSCSLEGGYHVVELRGFLASLKAAVFSLPAFRKEQKPPTGEPAAEPTHIPLSLLIKDAVRYGFKEMLDDISMWLVLGIIAAGAIAAVIPSNLIENFPGGELGSMLFILVISIPMYVCAVESTPIAAILILKGLSPGAALVFLMAGPATNLATMVLLAQTFGRRFLKIYLVAIAIMSVLAGLTLDWFLRSTGLEIISGITTEPASVFWTLFSIMAAIALLVLLAFSFYRLNWTDKWQNARGFGDRVLSFLGLLMTEKTTGDEKQKSSFNKKRLVTTMIILIALLYGLSGLYQIPPGSAGYELRLGKLVAADLPPGIHYHLPLPFEKVQIYRVAELRKTDLGFRTDINMINQWKKNPVQRSTTGWHSFFTTMHNKPEESLYLMGDENQLEAKFGIHYRIKDPTAFFFGYAKNHDLVSLSVESAMREYMASETIDEILTTHRGIIEGSVIKKAQKLLDSYGIGVQLLEIYVVDLHPPVEVVAAFRDVASAMEDRQTRIHQAYAAREAAMPTARGEAAKILAAAEAFAVETLADGTGRAESFRMRAIAYRNHRQATRFRKFIETMETTLPGTKKFIIPPESARQGHLRLWSGDIGNQAGLIQAGE